MNHLCLYGTMNSPIFLKSICRRCWAYYSQHHKCSRSKFLYAPRMSFGLTRFKYISEASAAKCRPVLRGQVWLIDQSNSCGINGRLNTLWTGTRLENGMRTSTHRTRPVHLLQDRSLLMPPVNSPVWNLLRVRPPLAKMQRRSSKPTELHRTEPHAGLEKAG